MAAATSMLKGSLTTETTESTEKRHVIRAAPTAQHLHIIVQRLTEIELTPC